MPRLKLRVYNNPGELQTFVRVRQSDGAYQRFTASIDTCAEQCLFDVGLLPTLAHTVIERYEVQQAGLAKHIFEVTEAQVSLYLEDETGLLSLEIQARVWFADTRKPLIGFRHVLDRAILHVDMPMLHAYLEFPDA